MKKPKTHIPFDRQRSPIGSSEVSVLLEKLRYKQNTPNFLKIVVYLQTYWA